MIGAHRRRATLPCLIAAACWLSLLAVLNGYPLVFPDSGTYIRQAIELEGVLDRPPYYSLFLLPLHARLSLWGIPLAQNLLVCLVLFRWMALAFPAATPLRMLIVVLLTGAFTYLPWYSNQIMPDVFTPLILLVVFIVTQTQQRLHAWEQAAWALALAVMLAFHQASPALAIGLLLAMLPIGWWQQRRRAWFMRSAVLVVVPVLLAVAAQTLYGYLVIGRMTPSPAAPYFLLARVVADGPGRDYLAEACPQQHYFLCGRLPAVSASADELLWDAQSPLAAMQAALGPIGALDEASAITRGTLRTHGLAEFGYALRNAAAQFVAFGSTGDLCPCLTGKIDRVIHELFPWEYERYAASWQNQAMWPYRAMSRISVAVVLLAGAVLLVRAILRCDRDLATFLVLLCIGLALNAVLMGVLSGPADRYQARIIWLVPLTCFTIVIMGSPWPRRPATSG